ncbi:MAG: carbon storage regulator [Gemmatimonadales bacterium]|nr:MAG: carbon storage regulator [Gemmatimonadales bacterium]
MLVLSRRAGESVVLDGGIRITVVQVEGGVVRLGVEAPAEVGIFREEVVERVARENARASVSAQEQEALRTRLGMFSSVSRASQDSGRGEEEA